MTASLRPFDEALLSRALDAQEEREAGDHPFGASRI